MAQYRTTITLTAPGDEFTEKESEFIKTYNATLQKAIAELIPKTNTMVIGTLGEELKAAKSAELSPEETVLIEKLIEEEEDLAPEEVKVVEDFEEGVPKKKLELSSSKKKARKKKVVSKD